MAINPETASCERCGGSCKYGSEVREYGPLDSETGYRDEMILCGYCVADEEAEDEDYADWMSDMSYDLGVEG